jgi:hypothetical protein
VGVEDQTLATLCGLALEHRQQIGRIEVEMSIELEERLAR